MTLASLPAVDPSSMTARAVRKARWAYSAFASSSFFLRRAARRALTADDVLLVPPHSVVVPREVSLKTRLTRGIPLNTPIVSAAMDTVTEARLAIALAQEGGI